MFSARSIHSSSFAGNAFSLVKNGFIYYGFIFPDGKSGRQSSGSVGPGSALGPDWHQGVELRGAAQVRWCVLISSCGDVSEG